MTAAAAASLTAYTGRVSKLKAEGAANTPSADAAEEEEVRAPTPEPVVAEAELEVTGAAKEEAGSEEMAQPEELADGHRQCWRRSSTCRRRGCAASSSA